MARYLASWGNVDREGLIRQVLDYQVKQTHPAALPGIDAFSRWCFDDAAGAAHRFVHRHTMMPYYLAFFTPARARAAEEALVAKSASIARVLPTTTLNTGRPRYLRACVDCIVQDHRVHGAAIWRRSHQLPVMRLCHLHERPLLASRIPFAFDRSLRFPTVDSVDVVSSLAPIDEPGLSAVLVRAIARQSLMTLEQPIGTQRWAKVSDYRAALVQLGYGGRTGTLRASEFEKDFVEWLRPHANDIGAVGRPRWWMRIAELPI